MIQRPPGVGAFEFVVLAALRAAQLTRGCTPRVDGGHKAIVTAQVEVAEGKVAQFFPVRPVIAGPVPVSGNPLADGLVPVPAAVGRA